MWGAAMAFDLETTRPKKRKAPPCDGASANDRTSCLFAEAVHQPTLQPQIILLCTAKVRVQILCLDGPERQVAGQFEIGPAAKRHREGIHRARRKARHARRRGFSAQQHLHVGSKPARVVIRQPRTEQVVDFMRRAARRKPGDSAAADVTHKSEPRIRVNRESAACTLAALAGSTLAWVDSDILILS